MKTRNLDGLIDCIFPFLLFFFFREFVLVYPVYMILFSSWGLGYGELSLLLSLWSVPVVLLELPTAVLADRWRRRNVLAAGMALKAAGYFIWIFSPSFSGACLGLVLWGCQEALCSGAEQALLFERMAERNLEERYEKAAGCCSAVRAGATAASMILGGLLYAKSPFLVLALSGAASLAGAFTALCLRDRKTSAPSGVPGADGSGSLRVALRTAFRRPGTIGLLAAFCLAGGVCGLVEEYEGLWYLQRYGLPLSWVGAGSALRFAAEGLGGMAADRMKRAISGRRRYGLPAGIAAAGCAFAAAAGLPGLWGAPPFLLYYFLMAAFYILLEGRLQAWAPPRNRATILSLANLALTAFAMFLSPLLGLAATAGGLASAFAAAGLLTVAAGMLAAGIRRS